MNLTVFHQAPEPKRQEPPDASTYFAVAYGVLFSVLVGAGAGAIVHMVGAPALIAAPLGYFVFLAVLGSLR